MDSDRKGIRNMVKRWVAGLLCICLLGTSNAFVSQAAEPASGQIEMEAKEEQLAPLSLQYLIVDSPYLESPAEQNVMIGFNAASQSIEGLSLEYVNQATGKASVAKATKVLEDAALFSMQFADASATGTYQLKQVRYSMGGKDYSIDLAKAGMEASFGVNASADTKPDGVIEDPLQGADIDVITIDENGKPMSQKSIQKAIGAVRGQSRLASQVKGTKNVVVVLDPGHDANHPGSVGNGLTEKDLNLSIAKYCKAELETYGGVKVYMTRTSDACPFKTSSAVDCNLGRVNYAKSVKANIYVSIHNNAGGANGSEIYYPNQNYNASVSASGSKLAKQILSNLVKLGLKNRGIKIRNSEDGSTYADGSIADYYAVIKNCKKQGIPAVIVEHAFVDSSDAAAFLNSNAKLKKLGVADATAIAGYFSLKKASEEDEDTEEEEEEEEPDDGSPKKLHLSSVASISDTSIKLSWDADENAAGYQIYRSQTPTGGYKAIATIADGETSSYKDKGLQSGINYYYKIKEYVDEDGKQVFGSASAAKRGKTISKTTIRSVKSTGNQKLKITWVKKSGASGYDIYRSTSKSGDYQKIGSVSGKSTTSYTDKEVKTGKKYYYKIYVKNDIDGSVGHSSFSAAQFGKSVGQAEILYVKATSNDTMKISWEESKGANGYYIYRSEDEDGGFEKIKAVDGKGTTSYIDEDLEPGDQYFYKVRARNNVNGIAGYSDASQVRYGSILDNPAIEYVVSVTSSELEISWEEIADADGYYIYRSTKKDKGYQKIATLRDAEDTEYLDDEVETGVTYYYQVRSWSKVDGSVGKSSASKQLDGQTVAKTKIKSITYANGEAILSWKQVNGAKGYIIARSTSKNGAYHRIATVTNAATVTYKDKSAKAGQTYYYKIQCYNRIHGETGKSGYCSPKKVAIGTEIMGESAVEPEEMAAYFNEMGYRYPTNAYASKGAKTITAFCKIVCQEAEAEGVRADVVFAQICHETGYLQFGGDVDVNQCNFAGIGATGNGAKGETFPNVRTGIRAQVQHLKAYACKDSLNKTCVDTRFSHVQRGTAPFVEWLGIQENPTKNGWATAQNYGGMVLEILKEMLASAGE